MLTRESFTRDEWDHLLRLLNIMDFSTFSTSHVLSNRKQQCHVQESSGKYSERGVGSGETETKEFAVEEPPECEERSTARFELSKQPGESRIVPELCFIPRQETDAKHQPKPNNVFSREATRWHSIFQHQGTGAERWNFKRSPRQETGARWGHPNRKVMEFHNMQVSDFRYLEKVLKNLRKKLNFAEEAPIIGIEALKTNVVIWGLFLCRQRWKPLPPFILDPVTLNFRKYTGTQEELHKLFDITQKLISDHHAGVLNVTPIKWTACSWTRSTLSLEQVITWTPSYACENVRSFRSSSKMENQGKYFRQSISSRELLGIDGETDWVRVEYFARTYVIGDPQEDPERPARSKHWTRKVWRSNHLHVNVQWHRMDREEIQRNVFQIPNKSRITRRESPEDTGHSFALETISNGMELSVFSPEGKWVSTATQRVERFEETGHPVFKSISAFSRGILKRNNDRNTIHFNADAFKNRTLISNDLLSKSARYQRSSLQLV